MRVYVIRHGESETNLQKKWSGWLDAPLTQKGREDAKVAGEFLKNISFDKIYSSDLSRAVDTKEIAIPGCDFERTASLREINIGSLEGIEYAAMEYEKRVKAMDIGFKEYGGETNEEFKQRVKAFFTGLEGECCDNVAVFCHSGVLRSMLDIVIGIDIPRNRYCCNNCAVAVFEYHDCVWRLRSWINLT